ncbi:MAG: choice-of-anchor D domain-containing protein [Nitrospirae bacterium]|nr:choice-of-anchor D domain-containing protein [Nitrospirota bacterium]
MRLRLLSVFFAVALLLLGTAAAMAFVGTPFSVETGGAPDLQANPAVASTPGAGATSQRFIVVYEEPDPARGDGNGIGLVAQIYDRLGAPALPPVVITSGGAATGDQTQPSVCRITDSKWLVVYSGAEGKIHSRTVTRAGALGADTVVSEVTGTSNPKCTLDRTNNHGLVVWEDTRDYGSTGIDIYAQLINPSNGAAQGVNFVISDDIKDELSPAAGEIGSNVGAESFIAWKLQNFDGTSDIVAATVDTGSGVPATSSYAGVTAWGSLTGSCAANDVHYDYNSSPDVANLVDSQMVVWRAQDGLGTSVIQGAQPCTICGIQSYDAFCHQISDTTNASQPAVSAVRTDLSGVGDDEAYITWVDTTSGNKDIKGRSEATFYSTSAGLGTVQTLAASVKDERNPSVAMGVGGGGISYFVAFEKVTSVDIFGVLVTPNGEISADPTALDFANQVSSPAGTACSTELFATVFNTGDSVLNVTGLTLAGGGAASYQISTNPTPVTLLPGGTTQVGLKFCPINPTGTKNATLNIASNDLNTPTLPITLTGVGVKGTLYVDPSATNPVLGTTYSWGATQALIQGLDLEASPFEAINVTSMKFTTSGTGNELTDVAAAKLSIWNDANTNSIIDAGELTQIGGTQTFLANNGPVTFAGAPLLTVPAGTIVKVVLTYDFNAGTGSKTFKSSLTKANTVDVGVTSTLAPTESFASNPVVGGPVTVKASPLLVVTSPALPFHFGTQNIGTTTDQTFTVTNNGSADAHITTITGLAAPFSVLSDTCSGATVAPAATCTFAIRFAPVAAGFFADTALINSDDPATPTTVAVDGTGGGIDL